MNRPTGWCDLLRADALVPDRTPRRDVVDRDSMNDKASAALGLQTRGLAEAELDAVFGGGSGGDRPSESLTTSGSGGAGDKPTAIIAVL
jgi:hypothetical protein